MSNISEEIAIDNTFNIVDILLIDHAYLKECIHVLMNDHSNKNEKLFYARTFLDTLKKHTAAEEKTVYDSLIDMDEIRMHILEGEAQHELVKNKYKTLTARLTKIKTLDDVTEAEVKVLASLIKHHIEEEEAVLFPKMRQVLDQGILNEIGFQFIILRKFTPQDLENYPELKTQVYQKNITELKESHKNIYQWSGNFVKKVNRYIGALIAQPLKNN